MSAIGIVVIKDDEITEEFYSLVNPEQHFDYFNVQLTGIDEELVSNAPTFPELWEQMMQIERYREEANYLLDNNIRTPEEVQERLTAVRKQLRAVKKTMSENDIRLLLLKKERRLLMHIEKDTDETMHVRPLTKKMTLDTFGHHVQKYRIPGKQIAAGEVREAESLWKN